MIQRIRIIRDEETQEEIARQILDLSPYILYNTNVVQETQLPDETAENPNKILLKPDIDIQYGDWILKDGIENKIKKISNIRYKEKEYLVKVEY